jgi:hypothetical protein
MAEAAVIQPRSVTPPPLSEDAETGSGARDSQSDDAEAPSDSSECESEESGDCSMDVDSALDKEVLPANVQMGGSYFATS